MFLLNGIIKILNADLNLAFALQVAGTGRNELD